MKYSDRLREMDFQVHFFFIIKPPRYMDIADNLLFSQEVIIFLQRLPTQNWGDHDIELLLSEAYVLKTVWQGAENHFKDLSPGGGSFGMLGR